MKHFLSLLALSAAAVIGTSAVASAQMQYTSNDALSTAQSAAEDSLGNDAGLVAIFTSGENPVSGGEGFDIETGTSSFWVYFHYSPTRDDGAAHLFVQPFPGVFFGGGQVIDTVDGITAESIFTPGGSAGNSDQMAAAIRGNGEYQVFREENGQVLVPVVTLAKFGEETLPGFPSNVPIWTVIFQDDEDTSKVLQCFVVSTTGQTLCFGDEGPASIEGETSGQARIAMQVVPTPATGRTRVTLAPAETGRGLGEVRVGLFNAAGQQVLDLTPSFADSG